MKLCREIPNFVKIEQKCRDTLREDLNTLHCYRGHKCTTKAFLCRSQYFYVLDGEL